ncbi:MAG TPA: glucose-6-phosphate dehydrogenase, partial [Candidatus Xenobia bacterium]
MERLLLDNPLTDTLLAERIPEPCAVVIFGASGDLSRRKLIPALFDQAAEQHLPVRFAIIGVARTPASHDRFRDDMREAVTRYARHRPDEAAWNSFAQALFYVTSEDGDLGDRLRTLAQARGCGANWLFYMAIPVDATVRVLRQLWQDGFLNRRSEQPGQPAGWARIVLEKPFGHDLEEARALNGTIQRMVGEDQIFRIDHYLGKEAVQNILVFRFANRIFEPVWNQRDIDHVEITVSETVGVERRASYYETSGALRDMIQNH